LSECSKDNLHYNEQTVSSPQRRRLSVVADFVRFRYK